MTVPRVLNHEDANEIGQLISVAFFAGPGQVFWCPYPQRRALVLPAVYAAFVRLAVRHGEVSGFGDPLHAVAVWFSPEFNMPTEMELVETGMNSAFALQGSGERGRRLQFDGHFDAIRQRVVPEPHWYLPFLAVAPDFQGQGAGSALMRHMLERVTPTGVPVYLDSSDERNLPFYERLGFREVERSVVPGTALQTWSMRLG